MSTFFGSLDRFEITVAPPSPAFDSLVRIVDKVAGRAVIAEHNPDSCYNAPPIASRKAVSGDRGIPAVYCAGAGSGSTWSVPRPGDDPTATAREWEIEHAPRGFDR